MNSSSAAPSYLLFGGGVPGWATPGRQLAACAAMHVVNDALFAGLYPLLPLVAADLRLSYAQVGAIKTVYSGTSAIFQVPAGMAAERAGEQLLLALGTGWVGLGLLAMALAGGFVPLLALACAAGLGGNIQHPVASAIVSRLYERRHAAGGRSIGWAIGTLNFAGDVGKVLAPLVVGAAAIAAGWRGALVALGALGAVFALVYLVLVPPPEPVALPHQDQEPPRAAARRAPPAGTWGIHRPGLFAVLSLIGILDSAARGAALVFIPFVLQGKGADPASMSFYFAVLFGTGAAGKFLCGPLGDRFGNVGVIAITELITAGALLGVLGAPLGWTLAALLPLGFVLNGTSSVLYASVATLVETGKRARGYGLYYTTSQLASAAAPLVYGALADRAGLPAALITLAAATATIAPLTLIAGRGLHQQ